MTTSQADAEVVIIPRSRVERLAEARCEAACVDKVKLGTMPI
jgi:predicted XRE-type DNA-binding protein